MRKFMMVLTAAMLMIVLAACGESATVKPGSEATQKSDLSLEEVFNKAQETNENLNSFHADMEISQTIYNETEEENMEMDMSSQIDFVQEPLALYQLTQMKMKELDDMDVETEMYLTSGALYMKESLLNQWSKIPTGDSNDFAEIMESSKEATVDYATLKEFMDDFKFEQNDQEYILTLKASGEKFKKLIDQQVADNNMLDTLSEDESNLLEDMEIHMIDYEIFIDKETFHTNKFNMAMEMSMTVLEEKATIKQDLHAVISKINELDEIVVPEEVLDQAVTYE